MLNPFVYSLGVTAFVLAALALWRWLDHRADAGVWQQLAATQPSAPKTFSDSLLDGLPEPAQRYFRFTIRPGASLLSVAEVSMSGEFSLGSKAKPDYLPMRARQILAAPHGFVWKLKAGKGMMRISGSDAAIHGNSWSRFWLFGLAPVARVGGNPDHARSAFGRYAAEAIFWTPAAVLPSETVSWSVVNQTTARMTMVYKHFKQAVDVTVDDAGRPIEVSFQRWSDANAEKTHRWQPFGGYLSEFRSFNGYRLPTRVVAGNHFGTADYFAFFKAEVNDIHFPESNKEV